jgi:hypothetical protein
MKFSLKTCRLQFRHNCPFWCRLARFSRRHRACVGAGSSESFAAITSTAHLLVLMQRKWSLRKVLRQKADSPSAAVSTVRPSSRGTAGPRARGGTQVGLVDVLPRSAMGKILAQQLRGWYS